MFCPHCHFKFVGPGVPRDAPSDMICPVCDRNMSDRPVSPVTKLQVFAMYSAAILAGVPLGLIAGGMVTGVFGRDVVPGVVQVGLVLLAMFLIGGFLGSRPKKMHSVAGRWLLLLGVATLPGGVLAAIVLATWQPARAGSR